MTKQRKQYSTEFKLEMVKLIEEQNQRVVDVAKQIRFNGALYAPYALINWS
ncbi:transposase [Moraxella porci]|uniref:transposase n=1 Tax=Moraxella porci TaxID=1288392 RepID=UPI00244CB896|nr:transposase [Moraxella porci]MDH2274529.1 transposase [Moraxella porci]